jgi:hypothetical protein
MLDSASHLEFLISITVAFTRSIKGFCNFKYQQEPILSACSKKLREQISGSHGKQ